MPEVAVRKAPVEKRVRRYDPFFATDIFRPGFPFGGSLFNLFPIEKETMDWVPAIEAREENGTFLVSAEVPGLKPEDVKVELTPEAIVLEGERKSETKEEKEGYYRSERAYGHFYRSIPLPEGVVPDKVKAELKEGLLRVTLPIEKVPENRRQIPIEAK